MNCLTVAIAMGASGQTQILMDNRDYPSKDVATLLWPSNIDNIALR